MALRRFFSMFDEAARVTPYLYPAEGRSGTATGRASDQHRRRRVVVGASTRHLIGVPACRHRSTCVSTSASGAPEIFTKSADDAADWNAAPPAWTQKLHAAAFQFVALYALSPDSAITDRKLATHSCRYGLHSGFRNHTKRSNLQLADTNRWERTCRYP